MKLNVAANAAQRMMIGLYSSGPFTPVAFAYRRSEVILQRWSADGAGVLVKTILTQF